MTQLYGWPFRFFTKGRKYQEQPFKTKTETGMNKKSTFRMKKVGARSPSKMLKSIDIKIGVVRSKNQMSKKIKEIAVSSDMFTPIVNSFNPVSKQIVSRYVKPKVIDLARYPSNNPRFDSHKKFSQLPKREITRCVSVDSAPHLKTTKKFTGTRCPQKVTAVKSRRDQKRPSSAPSADASYMQLSEDIDKRNPKVMRRAHSDIKTLESSKKLYDIVSKFPNSQIGFSSPNINRKPYKKQTISKICIEGLPDNISMKCDFIHEINPQLFGSLSSSNMSSFSQLKNNPSNTQRKAENAIKNYFTKRIIRTKTTKITKTPGDSRRVNNFISKIPEASLTRLKRRHRKFTTSDNPKTSLTYPKNRNLYCEPIEENPEDETVDENIDNNSIDSCRDLAKKRNEEIKKKFLEILAMENSKHQQDPKGKEVTNDDEVKMKENMGAQELECKEEKEEGTGETPTTPRLREAGELDHDMDLRDVLLKYCDGSEIDQHENRVKFRLSDDDVKRPELTGTDELEGTKGNSCTGETVPELNASSEIEQDLDLRDFLLEFYRRNELDYRDFQKSLRRSYFTLSLDESQNNSSLYETCKTHLSGDDLPNGRKPPPPSPNTEEDSLKDVREMKSTNIEEKSSTHRPPTDAHSICLKVETVDSKISKTEATEDGIDDIRNSPVTSTFARLSGKISTEERSDVFQTSQFSSDVEEGEEKTNEKDAEEGTNFIEQIRETNELNFTMEDGHYVSFQHDVKKIPSISDTYIDQVFPCFEVPNVENNEDCKVANVPSGTIIKPSCRFSNAGSDKVELTRRNNCLDTPKCRWKSEPTFRQQNNCSNRCSTVSSERDEPFGRYSKNVSSASNNSCSINSNMELMSEYSTTGNSDIQKGDISNSSQRASVDAFNLSSEISSLSGSPSELLEESKIALESLMMRIGGGGYVPRLDESLNDILKELSDLDRDDTFRRMFNEKNDLFFSSSESWKKDEDSTKSQDLGNNEENIFIRVSDTEVRYSKTDFGELDKKLPSSTVVYFKSPSESYHISRESFPECSDGTTVCENEESGENDAFNLRRMPLYK